MTSSGTPAGWHPDPGNPASALRWWDGTQWTEHTHPLQPGQAPYGPPDYGQAPYGQGPYSYQPQGYGPGFPGGRAPVTAPKSGGLLSQSPTATTAIAFGLLYIAIDVFAHFFILGFIPLVTAIRATKRREPLAPVAVVVAAIVIGISIFMFAKYK